MMVGVLKLLPKNACGRKNYQNPAARLAVYIERPDFYRQQPHFFG